MFIDDPAPEPPKPAPQFFVTKGLGGQDDNLETLQTYFKELQKMTVETCMDPDLDLLTFALGAHYFGVIMLKETKEVPRKPGCSIGDGGGVDAEEEESEMELEDSDFGPSPVFNKSVPVHFTPAPISSTPIPKPITGEEFLALSEKEKVLRWREAFNATINCELDDDEDRLDTRSDSPVLGRQSDEDAVNPFTANDPPEAPALDKGKMREQPTGVWDSLQERGRHSPYTSEAPTHPDDFINWPEDAASESEAPPSTTDDGAASSVEDFHSFGHPGIPQDFELEDFHPQPGVLGREYLQTDDSREPVPELPEIPADPILEKHIRDSAIRYRDQLRAMRVERYEEQKARKLMNKMAISARKESPPPQIVTSEKPVGLIYLATSQHVLDPLHMGECTIGAYIAPEYRTMENASDAIHAVVEHAFRDRDCHRLQAIIVDHQDKIDALTMFSTAGFRHEGIRRRAFYSSLAFEWKDVTYFAMLATEWVMDQNQRGFCPRSLWDEVLSRHQREQEEIIKMQESKFGYGLKRTNSMETIRERVDTVPTALSLESGAESNGFSTDSSSSPINPKRRRHESDDPVEPRFKKRSSVSSSSSSADSEWDMMGDDFGRPKVPAFRGPPVSLAGPSNMNRRSQSGQSSASSNASSSSSKWSLFRSPKKGSLFND